MQYFKDCKSTDDVKRLYRELAKKLHPDHGGNEKEMKELNRQYNDMIEIRFEKEELFRRQAQYANKFYDWSQQEKEDMFQKGQQEYHRKYGGYGGFSGYQYSNPNMMREEYFKQRNDPRLADYERMKSAYQTVCNNLHKSNFEIKQLYNEIERLKKKVQTQKRQLDKLKKGPKPEKKKLKRINKRSTSSTIHL